MRAAAAQASSTSLSELPDLAWVAGSIADDVGRVLRSGDRILRAIHPGQEPHVRALLASGLVDELVAAGLFPRTTVTDLTDAHHPMVLEHERLERVTYPFEWSFSMFREAALTVLRVNQAANRYGYELKDCHGMNVIFAPSGPRFVDLGSFIRKTDPTRGWIAYDAFERVRLYTLAARLRRMARRAPSASRPSGPRPCWTWRGVTGRARRPCRGCPAWAP